MQTKRYVIGSGWWCLNNENDKRIKIVGDDIIRSQHFHKLWYESVIQYSSPQKIIIVDSCSPVLPELNKSDSRIEILSLNINAGHPTAHIGKLSGCVRAMLIGMMYALQCDTDYYVYVEQDALLYGEGLIEYCIDKMKTPYMFGSGKDTPQITQQSLFIIRQDAIFKFIQRLNAITQPDKVISPEEKFHLSCCHGPIQLLSNISMRNHQNEFYSKLNWYINKYLRCYDYLPIGYGRVRPINFNDKMFYFQHGTYDELNNYLQLTGIKWNL